MCGYFSPVDKNTAGCTFCGEKKVRQSSNMSDGLKHLTTTHTTITHFLKVFFLRAQKDIQVQEVLLQVITVIKPLFNCTYAVCVM